jgi:putative spermidine/putrescine transport system permease protein
MSDTDMQSNPQRKLRGERKKISIFTLFMTLLLLMPLLVVIAAALNEDPYLLFPPERLSFHWFAEALNYPSFQRSLSLSLRVAVIVTVIGLVITVPAAIAVTRGSVKARRAVQLATAMPLVTPDILLALGLLIMFSQMAIASNPISLVMGHILVGLPIALHVAVAGMAGINPNLEDAAATLGASKFKAFMYVTLPNMLPGIASSALFLFIFSFDNVSISLFLSAPGQTALPINLFQYLENNADPTGAAMSAILVIVGLIVALLLGWLGGLGQLAGGKGKTR